MNDAQQRAAHEVDVVALGPGSGPRRRVVEAIGEAKLRELGVSDLRRLERIRGLLSGAPGAQFILVSELGFAEDLKTEAAARLDVHLVSLEEIYSS